MDVLTFADAAEWETWLDANVDTPGGVWLKIAKKGSTGLCIADALEVSLCYGWIDSQRKGLDDDYYLQKYSPRRPKGAWSARNVGYVETLLAAGRMKAPGLAEVAAAKADGRWDAAYAAQADATVPPDLAAALEENETAKVAFGQLGKTGQYAVILQLLKARTPATRAARLEKAVKHLDSAP